MSMAPWVKTSVKIMGTGEKTIRYESFRNVCIIESRKRTSYFLIRPDGTEKEYQTLAAAKEAAEKES